MLGTSPVDLVLTVLWFGLIGGFTWWAVEHQRADLEEDVGDAIDELERRTGQMPPPEVRGWLYPYLERRLLWEAGGPALALGVGITVLQYLPGGDSNTWWFVAVAMATYVGLLAGALGAALTQRPLELEGRRVATVQPRAVRDFVEAGEVGALSGATMVALATLAAGFFFASRDLDQAGSVIVVVAVVVLCLIAAAGSVRHYLAGRHMPARHVQDLKWQAEALRYLLSGIGYRTFRLAWITAVVCGIFVLNHTGDPSLRVLAWVLIVGAVSSTVILHLVHRALARAVRAKVAVAAC